MTGEVRYRVRRLGFRIGQVGWYFYDWRGARWAEKLAKFGDALWSWGFEPILREQQRRQGPTILYQSRDYPEWSEEPPK